MFFYLLPLVVSLIVTFKPTGGKFCKGKDYNSVIQSLDYNVDVVCLNERDIIQYARRLINRGFCCVLDKASCKYSKRTMESFYREYDTKSSVYSMCFYAFSVLFYALCDCPTKIYRGPPVPPTAPLVDRSCGMKLQVTPKIVGGEPAKKCEFPWMVGFQVGRYLCGGVLVDTEHVITAAHCLFLGYKSEMFLKFGSVDKDHPNFVTSVDRIALHPMYNRTKDGYYHDIAILTSSQKVKFNQCIRPICLPDGFFHGISDTKNCYTIGWGETEVSPPVPERFLRKVNVPIIEEDHCRALLQGYRRGQLCGSPKDGKDACVGDSGGPLMCPEKNYWVLAGIISFGFGCGLNSLPGVYTDVKYHMDWIMEIIREPDLWYPLHRSSK